MPHPGKVARDRAIYLPLYEAPEVTLKYDGIAASISHNKLGNLKYRLHDCILLQRNS